MRCVISGAADGIGRALAQRYGGAGYEIVAVDEAPSSQTEAMLRQDGIEASFMQTDLGDPAAIEGLVQKLGAGPPIHVLVHGAGINAVAPFGRLSIERQRSLIAINFTGPLLLTAGLLGQGKIAAGGSLIFVASLAHFTSYPGAAAYAASQDGLASYARSLAVALASRHVHVLTVFLAPTRTPAGRRDSPDNAREQRMASEKVAEAIFLAARRRRRVLVPGMGNKLFALIGRYLPRLAEWTMRRRFYMALLEKG